MLQIHATKQSVREEAAYLRKKEGSLPIKENSVPGPGQSGFL